MLQIEPVLNTVTRLVINIISELMSLLEYFVNILDRFTSINSNLMSIYGILFTIIIGIIFYVYGKNGIERKVLQNGTGVNKIIKRSLIFFTVSTLAFPHNLFFVINSVFILHILCLCFKAFHYVESFYKNVVSEKNITNEYIKENIKENISKDYETSEKNKKINDDLEGLTSVTRFLTSDELDEYQLVRALKAGFVKSIDVNTFRQLLSENIFVDISDISQNPEKQKDHIYIPFDISIGAEVSAGTILYGVKKEIGDKFVPKNAVATTTTRIIPVQDYLDTVLNEKFKAIFTYIKEGNHKLVEATLDEASVYINLVFDEEKFEPNLISQISSNFIYPLQEEAFKSNDLRVIREVSSFSLNYLRKSIEQKSKDKFEIFITNLTTSFYYSLRLADKEVKKNYHEVLNHWFYELSEYSLKPKLKNNPTDKFYFETIERTFVALNNMLKYAYEKTDKESIKLLLLLVNSIYNEDNYQRDESNVLKKVRRRKGAFVFGFTSCVYRDMRRKGNFDPEILNELYGPIPKRIEDLLKSASGALARSKNNKYNWDNLSWSNQDHYLGTKSGMVTTSNDITLLLIDRIFEGLKNNEIKDSDFSVENDNELLAIHFKSEDIRRADIHSCIDMTDEAFDIHKESLDTILSNIKKNYDERIEKELIEQKINVDKVEDYAKQNFEGYSKNALLRSISKLNTVDSGSARGYNRLFYKERFVEKTNLHISSADTFGEGLARSEDNYLLNKIIVSKSSTVGEIAVASICQLLKEKSTSFDYALIWAQGRISIENTCNDIGMVPYWQIEDGSLKHRGLQGKVGSLEIYNIYPFNDGANHVDTLH